MKKFLTKFHPKKLPNINRQKELDMQQLREIRKEAFQKYTQISASNGKPGLMRPLQFIICDGNNSKLIRRVMETRLALEAVPQTEED